MIVTQKIITQELILAHLYPNKWQTCTEIAARLECRPVEVGRRINGLVIRGRAEVSYVRGTKGHLFTSRYRQKRDRTRVNT